MTDVDKHRRASSNLVKEVARRSEAGFLVNNPHRISPVAPDLAALALAVLSLT